VPAPIAWVRVLGTKGWTRDNPHLFNYGGGQVVALSNTGATLRTTVYRIPSLGNLFVPNGIPAARISYRALGKLSGTTDAAVVGVDSSPSLRVSGSPSHRLEDIAFTFVGLADDPVTLSIYDVRGRMIVTWQAIPGEHGLLRTRLPESGTVGELPSGLYFVRAVQGASRVVARAILVGQ
jgi:hypothetical protein